MYNLIPVMAKYQTNENREIVYKNNRSVVFKSVKTMKNQERPENCDGQEDPKEEAALAGS